MKRPSWTSEVYCRFYFKNTFLNAVGNLILTDKEKVTDQNWKQNPRWLQICFFNEATDIDCKLTFRCETFTFGIYFYFYHKASIGDFIVITVISSFLTRYQLRKKVKQKSFICTGNKCKCPRLLCFRAVLLFLTMTPAVLNPVFICFWLCQISKERSTP